MDTAMVGSRPENSVRSASTRRRRPSQEETEAAVRTLIEWAPDAPDFVITL